MNISGFTRWIGLVLGSLLLFAQVGLGQEFEVLFYEGFENGGSAPLGWTQEYVTGSRAWRFENGGYAPPSAPTFRRPSAAYKGEYNALFQDQSIGPIRKLVTPQINLIPYGTSTIKPTLTFWHAQDAWAGANDELKVYYRPNSSSGWILLDHYTLPEKDWVYKEITLPDDAKTTTCQIAFEGKSNWGWGVCVDEVKIEERGLVERTVESFDLVKRNVVVPSGSTQNVFGNLLVVVSGNINEIPVNSVKLNYTGTDINDIAQVNLYHTRDSIFSVQSKLGGEVTVLGNEIVFTPTFNLRTGTNYLWFTFDINPEASHGNVVDFNLNANSVNLGDKWFPQDELSPSGFGTIWESLVFTDFSSDIGWIRTDLWEIGEPQGGGVNDPNHSFSGANVLATNLDGDYPPAIGEENPETAISPRYNAKYYQNLTLRFRRWLNIDYFDKGSIRLSVDEGESWVNLYQSSTTVLDNYWKPTTINLSRWATRKENLEIMFSIDSTNHFTEYGGWNIDNFAITGEFIHSDVGVTQMVSPTQTCGTGDMIVSVMVKNFGGATVSTPFEVGYSLDGGETYVKEVFTETIDSEEELLFIFDTPVDLSFPGLKNFSLKTFLENDQDETNDSHTTSLYSFPVEDFPHQTSFEQSNSHWYPGGINSSWQWGVPGGNHINHAPYGTKVWATGLTRNYNNNELSYLESPCFDFTDAQMPVLSFMYTMYIEEGNDGLSMEYSVDGGATWQLLPEHEHYAFNWYDTESVTALNGAGWSENQAEYIEVKNLLPNDVVGKPSVKFRFVFASDGTSTFEGAAIDLIKLYELPYDLGIVELNSPESDCEIGYDTPFGLRIKNYGYRTVPEGTQVPVHLQLNNETVKTETYTLTTAIVMDGHEDVVTENKFNLFNHGQYDITAFTNLAVDDSRINDTLYAQVEVYGIPGYSLGPDIGTMQPDTVKLDAGADYVSYTWYKFNDPNWEIIDGEEGQLYELPVNGWGEYRVDVENDSGCTAFAIVSISESDKDVGVTAISNLASACEHYAPINPKVTITSFNSGTFDGVETIPLVVEVNDVVVLNEELTPEDGWGGTANTLRSYTFSGSIDLAETGEYRIAIYTDMSKDLDRSNDTIKTVVYTWGNPKVDVYVKQGNTFVEFDGETIVSTEADSIEFKVTEGYATYLWERQALGSAEWNVVGNEPSLKLLDTSNPLPSATYRVTVADEHGCGEDVKEIFVNAADLTISQILRPSGDVLCYTPQKERLALRVKNVGHDTFNAGTVILGTAYGPTGTQETTVVISSPLAPQETIDIEFSQNQAYSVGEHFYNFTIECVDDPNEENNFKSHMLVVNPSPTVTISPNVVYKIFDQYDDYTVSPVYTGDIVSYLWDDDEYYPSEDPELFIWGPPIKEFYTVVVENEHGCSASASIQFITGDLEILAITSPKNDCEFLDDTPVRFTLYNNGNTIYNAGTQLNVNVFFDGNFLFTETATLSTLLSPQASTTITLGQTVDLGGLSTATIRVDVSSAIPEVYQNNNSLNKSVNALGYPIISLGEDRDVHAWEEILDPGYFNTYVWQDNSTNRAFTATESGTYSVTVADFTGCEGFAEVELTFFIDDIEIVDVIQPQSGCMLTNAEPVTLKLRNSGTYSLEEGSQFSLGYQVNGQSHTEEYVLNQPFEPTDVLIITFNQMVDLSLPGTYDISVWTELENDMIPENNMVNLIIESYPEVEFSFNLPPQVVTYTPTVLDAGEDFEEYLWQDGSTEQTFTVIETGFYHVTVTDANGCTGYDEVDITYLIHSIEITDILSPISGCELTQSESVTISFENKGNYDFEEGMELILGREVNGVDYSEEYELQETFLVGEELTVTFQEGLDLSQPGTYTIRLWVKEDNDMVLDVSVVEYPVDSYPPVNFSFGMADTVYTYIPITLDAGAMYVAYQWQDGSTQQTYEVTQTGLYSVTVTDANGCLGYDEVYIIFNKSDINIVEVITPAEEQCRIPNMPIEIVIKNERDQALGHGAELTMHCVVGYDTPMEIEETLVLSNIFGVNDEITYLFDQRLNLAPNNSYTLDFRIDYAGVDGNVYEHVTNVHPTPSVNLGPDTAYVEFPYTLVAGVGGVTYLWSNGSTASSIEVLEPGTYWLMVTNEWGCTASDTIVLLPLTMVNPIFDGGMLSVYPNPVNHNLYVSIDAAPQNEFRIELLSALGQVIYLRDLYFHDGSIAEIDVSSYPAGIYLLRISSNNQWITLRVVVDR